MHKIPEAQLKPLIITVTLLYFFLDHQHVAIIKKYSGIHRYRNVHAWSVQWSIWLSILSLLAVNDRCFQRKYEDSVIL